MRFKTKYKVIFFTGPPLSGKDTQAKLLAKKLKGKFLVSHILIDKFLKGYKGRYLKLGKRIFDIKKEFQRRFSGGLYSPEIVGYVISEKIKKEADKNILIFSGSPRLIEEAKIELKTLKELKIDFLVIFLKVPEKELYKRAKKRRRKIEDKEEVLKKRIENYKKYVIPTKNFIKKRAEVKEINGEGSIKEIHQRILKALNLF